MHDCLIVGSGVIGLSLAYELAGHGLKVRLLDRGLPGREASWAGAGTLPPAAFRPEDPPLAQLAGLSHRLHPAWSAELREQTGIDNGLRPSGGIYLSDTEPSCAQELATWIAAGVRAQRLSFSELASLEPNLARAHFAYLLPEESQLRNPWHLRALVAGCQLRRVEITAGVAADDFEIRAGRIHAVRTTQGSLQAGQFCITAGSWTSALATQLGFTLGVKPLRGQIVLLATLGNTLRHIVNFGKQYLVPRSDGRLLVGSTEEDAGFDCHPTAGGIGGLLAFALQLVPQLGEGLVERTWAGLRPAAERGLPYLGQVPGLENAFVAAGHFRAGLQLSPATAVVMGELMRGERPQIDLSPFQIPSACRTDV